MEFALAECHESENLLASLAVLIFRVSTLNSNLPIEFDAFESCEIISLAVLSFQLESFRRFFEIEFTSRGMNGECVNNIENHITTHHFICFEALSKDDGSFLLLFFVKRCDLCFMRAIAAIIVNWLHLNQLWPGRSAKIIIKGLD